jgi:hypothetical protein
VLRGGAVLVQSMGLGIKAVILLGQRGFAQRPEAAKK